MYRHWIAKDRASPQWDVKRVSRVSVQRQAFLHEVCYMNRAPNIYVLARLSTAFWSYSWKVTVACLHIWLHLCQGALHGGMLLPDSSTALFASPGA